MLNLESQKLSPRQKSAVERVYRELDKDVARKHGINPYNPWLSKLHQIGQNAAGVLGNLIAPGDEMVSGLLGKVLNHKTIYSIMHKLKDSNFVPGFLREQLDSTIQNIDDLNETAGAKRTAKKADYLARVHLTNNPRLGKTKWQRDRLVKKIYKNMVKGLPPYANIRGRKDLNKAAMYKEDEDPEDIDDLMYASEVVNHSFVERLK